MSVNRDEQILRHLHFVNSFAYRPANTDRLSIIRPFLSTLQKTFKAAVHPEDFQSLQSAMSVIGFSYSVLNIAPIKCKILKYVGIFFKA